MEVKFPDSAPLWLAEIFSALKIYPATFSKYGVCFKEQIFAEPRSAVGQENEMKNRSINQPGNQEEMILC